MEFKKKNQNSFEFIQNLIIIDVNFNGIPLKMILISSDDIMLFDFPRYITLILMKKR